MWSLSRVTAILLQTIWVLLLGGAFVLKLSEDGAEALAKYLTNWVWFANLIFFAIDLVLGYAEKTRVFEYFSFYAVWVIYGLNWTVFWLVFPLVHENPQFLLDLIETIAFGKIMVGDRLLHVLTLVVNLLWILLRHDELRRAFGTLASDRNSRLSSGWRFVLVWLLAGVVAPLLVFTIYRACNDPAVVYGVDLAEGVIALAAVLVLLVASGLTLYGVSGLGSAATRYGLYMALSAFYVLGTFVLLGWWLAFYGARSFFEHFELWLLSYAAVYLTVCIFVTPFMRTKPRASRRLSRRASIVWFAFWPLNSLVWNVFWLAFVVLGEAPWRTLDLNRDMRISGGEFLLDRVIRVLPLIALLIYVFAWRETLAEAARAAVRHRLGALYVVVMSWLVPLLVFAIWLAIFWSNNVYGVSSPIWAWLVMWSLLALSFGGSTLLIFAT